jgi:hypothetical protein
MRNERVKYAKRFQRMPIEEERPFAVEFFMHDLDFPRGIDSDEA